MRNLLFEIFKFLTNRLFIFFILVCLMFFVVVFRFFELQIVEGEFYQNEINTNITRNVPIKSARGLILDRYGRPLATNKPIFIIQLERSMFDNQGRPLKATISADTNENRKQILADKDSNILDLNNVLRELIKLLKENNEKFIDNFPISNFEPFAYLLNGDKEKELRYIKDLLGKDKEWMPADKFIEELREWYSIDKSWTNIEARNVLSIRCNLTLQQYLLFQPITIAKDVSFETVSTIEELDNIYYGIQIDTDSLRVYNHSLAFSNIIGYTGKINEIEYEEKKDKGYKKSDYVGRTGIEEHFEDELRGTDGIEVVEVNNANRKIATLSTMEAIPGKKIFLSIDIDFQIKVQEILKETVKEILAHKIRGTAIEKHYNEKDILSSIVKTNNLSIFSLFESEEGSISNEIKNFILDINPEIDITNNEGFEESRNILYQAILNGDLNSFKIVEVLNEQGLFKEEEETLIKLKKGQISVKNFLLDRLENDILTPAIIGLPPYSASSVSLNAKNGETLAAVGYPNYDNNLFANGVDASYLNKINYDRTSPFINRPYYELLAPGSVFKMITAITGLETETINVNTKIHDYVTFVDAGVPYATCMSKLGHGDINVIQALEVSCNYFFYETVYRMGNAKNGNKDESINKLNKYMMDFGLNDKSGVEIDEKLAGGNGSLNINSPSLKEYILTRGGKIDVDPNELRWTDGYTIRTAIGQDSNSYSSAVMAKYIATIATKGTRFKSTLVNKIEKNNGEIVKSFEPTIEKILDYKESTWNAIYTGMKNVTTSSQGTARRAFVDFPVTVGGKTGTAELDSDKGSHTTFGGFAPFDNPEIALYVIIPNGDSKAITGAASMAARKILEAYFGLDLEPQRPIKDNVLIK